MLTLAVIIGFIISNASAESAMYSNWILSFHNILYDVFEGNVI